MQKLGSGKINISIITAIIVFCSMLFGSSLNAKAYSSVELILSETGEASPSIFSAGSPPIAPGSSISQDFSIRNNTGRNYNIEGFKLTDFRLVNIDSSNVQDTSLINYFTDNVAIKLEEKGLIWNTTIFDGCLTQLLSNDGIKFAEHKISISKGDSKEFAINISMKETAGNRLQGVQASFGTNFSAVSGDGSSANTGGGSGTGGSTGGNNTGSGGTGTGSNSTESNGGTNTGTESANINTASGGADGRSTSPIITPGDNSGNTDTKVPATNDKNGSSENPDESISSNPSSTPAEGKGGRDFRDGSGSVSTSVNEETKTKGTNAPSRLIQTGSFIDLESVMALGTICILTGMILILKKSKR